MMDTEFRWTQQIYFQKNDRENRCQNEFFTDDIIILRVLYER